MGIKSLKNFFALEPPVLPPKVYSEKANMQKDVMYKDASYSICGCLGVLFIYFERESCSIDQAGFKLPM
jgi:hypothetical protein